MNDLRIETLGAPAAEVSLLFMHGPGFDHSYFRPYVDALGQHFQLVFYDHRLNGRSPRADPDSVNLRTMAEDARRVAHAVCRSDVVVVAHSFAAWVALQLAEQHPPVVSGLVLVAPGLSPTAGEALVRHSMMHGSQAQQEAIAAAFSGQLAADDDLARAYSLVFPLYLARDTDPRVAGPLLRGIEYSVVGFYRFLAACFGSLNWQTALAQLQLPLLVVTGDEDWLERDPTMPASAIGSLAPNATTVTLPHCGHLPFVDQPALFCETVRHWVLSGRSTP